MAAEIQITGYYPGLLGQIVELHGSYYAEHWGFDISFEAQVGRELSDFAAGFDPGRDGLWAASADGRLAGCVALDGGAAASEGARLRWLMVHPEHQGGGLGRRLLERALGFCRQRGYGRVFLWTFQGLEAARSLYVRAGFELVQENRAPKWGGVIVEQRYELALNAGSDGQAGNQPSRTHAGSR